MDHRNLRQVTVLHLSFLTPLLTPPNRPRKTTTFETKQNNPATNVYTPQALARTGIPVPAAGYVTADDVERGKPEPDPYLAGAARVGVDPKNCTSVRPVCVWPRARESGVVV
jgi:hypothetical protein